MGTTYLLWFDEQLTPYLRPSKPPAAAELARAKWGIGGQALWLQGGKVWGGRSRSPDARTAVAIDRERKLLFLALGQYVSPRLVLQELANLALRTGCCLMAAGRVRWLLAKMRRAFQQGFCMAAGGRWRGISE